MADAKKTPEQTAIDAFDAAETAPVAVVPEPPVDLDDEGNPVVDGEPELDADGNPVVEGEDGGEGEGEQTQESVAAAEKKAADAKAAAKDKKPPADAKDRPEDKPKPTKEDLAEADKLQLKGATRERFVGMSTTIREQATQIEAFKKPFEGLVDFTKPPAEVAKTIDYVGRAARDQMAWDDHMQRIGLQPDQFGRLMGYGAAINSTDPAVLGNAREVLLKEIGFIDAKLGNKSEFYDPLAEHPDLAAKVKKGAIDEEDAIETARLRNATKARETQQQQEQQQGDQAAAINAGLESLKTVGGELKARDGQAVFDAKMAAIKGALQEAVADAPPARWPSIAKKLYEGVTIAPPSRRPIPGGKAPNRQTHEQTGSTPVRQPNNALDAFDVGVEEAKAQGY